MAAEQQDDSTTRGSEDAVLPSSVNSTVKPSQPRVDADSASVKNDSQNPNHHESNGGETQADVHPKHAHHHKKALRGNDLEEETLKSLKTYLRDKATRENLDEDDVATHMVRTDRIATDRIRYHYDPNEDTDDEDDQLMEWFHEEENNVLAHDFFKHVVSKAQHESPAPLDKKTVNWLKKAMGLVHRRHDDLLGTSRHQAASREQSEDSDGDSVAPKPKRLTRGMTRSTRVRKREQRAFRENQGLDALLSAVAELEAEHGPFSVSPQQRRTTNKVRKRKARALIFPLHFILLMSGPTLVAEVGTKWSQTQY